MRRFPQSLDQSSGEGHGWLSGGCTVEGGVEAGAELRADDAIVIRASHSYGFRCGDEGMEFLTIRTAEASTDSAR